MRVAPPLATTAIATAPINAMPSCPRPGMRNPNSRRLSFESAGSTSSTIATRMPSSRNCKPIRMSNSTGVTAGTRVVFTPPINAATKSSAINPAMNQVQKPVKLSFGQRVGQPGEIAECESFTAKLRGEVAQF